MREGTPDIEEKPMSSGSNSARSNPSPRSPEERKMESPQPPVSPIPKEEIDSPEVFKRFPIARRPKPQINPAFMDVQLCTNYFQIGLGQGGKLKRFVSIYGVSFTPEVGSDNTRLRRTIIRKLTESINAKIGEFIHRGTSLYGLQGNAAKLESFIVQTVMDSVEYTVQITEQSMIDLQGISGGTGDEKNERTANMFMNAIIKELMRTGGYKTVGRNMKYFHPDGAKIPDLQVEVWQGYKTSVHFTSRGLLLEVDYASRVLRTETAFDYIDTIWNQGKDEAYIREIMTGKSFLVGYGNKKTYPIADVVFEHSPNSKEFLWRGKNTNLVTYFQEHYGIDIKYKKDQPLLLNYEVKKERDRKTGKSTIIEKNERFFVPELCYMTGIPEEMKQDYNVMKKLDIYTKLSPDQRVDAMKSLISKFESMSVKDSEGKIASEQPGSIMRKWGINFQSEPIKINGRRVRPVELQARKVPIGIDKDKGTFNMAQAISTQGKFTNWILACGEKDQKNGEYFLSQLRHAGKQFEITFADPAFALCKQARGRDIIAGIQDADRKIMQNGGKTQIIVILLPIFAKGEYRYLKTELNKGKMLSQIVLIPTLKKGLSAMGKIAIQMATKCSGFPWVFTKPRADIYPQLTMVIGIDVSREGKNTVLGFAASIGPSFEKYFTQTLPLKPNQEIAESLAPLMEKALKQFKAVGAPNYPSYIIIYRDGVGETQREMLYQLELESMFQGISAISEEYKPNITFATINKKGNTRFFRDAKELGGGRGRGRGRGRGGYGGGGDPQLANAAAGTVVVDGILEGKRFEFLLMPHYVNQGTGTPSHFCVLYNSLPEGKQSMEDFIQLSNCFCNIYYNWMGPIRTPAPCKYALQAAKMRAKYTMAESTTPTNFYYL